MNCRRRILYIVNAYERDAPNAVTASIGQAMEEYGWKVQYVSWSRGGPLQLSLSAGGADTAVLGRGFISNAWSLSRILRSFRPDIVHASLARPTMGTALAKCFAGRTTAQWVASDHGVHEWHEKGRLRGAIMEGVMPGILAHMDAIVTVSDSAASELHRRGVSQELVYTVPNGVDMRRFYPRPRGDRSGFLAELFPDGDTEEIFLMGSAGNLRRLKGYDTLIDAMPLVLEEVPLCRCVIWGDGPEKSRLEAQATRLGVEHAVRFCGYDAALEHKLPLLDLYVQASRSESFGMAVAEAMACAVPVIVSDAGGLPLLVLHEEFGLVFPKEDAGALASQILVMHTSKRQRTRMGNAGRLRVLQHFTRQRMVQQMKHLYETLLPECRNVP